MTAALTGLSVVGGPWGAFGKRGLKVEDGAQGTVHRENPEGSANDFFVAVFVNACRVSRSLLGSELNIGEVARNSSSRRNKSSKEEV